MKILDVINKYIWAFFIFIMPFSLRYAIYEKDSFIHGYFNPWLTAFLYLPELILILAFIIYLFNKKRKVRLSGFLWFLYFIFLINSYFVSIYKYDTFLSAMFLLRGLEIIMIFLLIKERILIKKHIIWIMIASAVLQIVIAQLQVSYNHSLSLWFLGESKFDINTINVAKINLKDGLKQIRAYGTFLHPNIFAAYLLIVYALALNYLKKYWKLIFTGIFFYGIYLSHSRAAILTFAFSIFLYILLNSVKSEKNKRISSIFIFICIVILNIFIFEKSMLMKSEDSSIQARLQQNIISKNMLMENPFGVGINAFTLQMEKYPNGKLNCGLRCNIRKYLPWEFQPVHNNYFLAINETGIQFLILFIIFVLYLLWNFNSKINYLFLSIIFLASFDHFFWDSWIAFILLAFIAGFFGVKQKNIYNNKNNLI